MTKQYLAFGAVVLLHMVGFAGCSCKTKAEENIAKPNFQMPAAQIETVTGVVVVNHNNQVAIEVRPDSRSKVTYEITGARKDEVAALKGKRVTATGMVKNLSPFHKLIEVTSVEK